MSSCRLLPRVVAFGAAFLALLQGFMPAADAAIIQVGFPLKIQDAVDLALSNADSADIIRVFPGTYAETVVVDFTGSNQSILNIEGVNSGSHLIDGGVKITDARLVTLFNFVVSSPSNDGVAGIRVRDTVGCAILNCKVQSGDDYGVDARDCFEVIIDNCTFSGMEKDGLGQGGYGVYIDGFTDHQVTDSVMNNCEAGGLFLRADRSRVRNCNTFLTGPDDDTSGMWIEGLQNVVRDCRMDDNDGFGITVLGACTVRDCRMDDNGRSGLRLGTGGLTTFTGGQVRGNKMRDNTAHGILVQSDQEGCEIRDNDLRKNGSAGMRLLGGRHFIYKNVVRDTKNGGQGGHGILIESSSDGNNLEKNTVRDNSGQGIVVQGDSNYLSFNAAQGNDGFVDSGTNNQGRANTTKGGSTNDFP